MSAQEIDQYLAALEEPKRAALALLRQTGSVFPQLKDQLAVRLKQAFPD